MEGEMGFSSLKENIPYEHLITDSIGAQIRRAHRPLKKQLTPRRLQLYSPLQLTLGLTIINASMSSLSFSILIST